MLILPCTRAELDDLCRRYHAYQGAGKSVTYCFGAYEDERLVAAYAWQPPPVGSAKSVNPYVPYGVLSLSHAW